MPDMPALASVRFTALDLADYGDPGKPLPDYVRKAVEQAMTEAGFETLAALGYPAHEEEVA